MLTDRQRTILELFKEAEIERLPPPTMRAVADALDLSPGTVTDHVKRLVRDRWLEQPEGHTKYRLTDRAQEMLRRIRVAEGAKRGEKAREAGEKS
jgi:DNA-binding MarR family transcriptional regulator